MCSFQSVLGFAWGKDSARASTPSVSLGRRCQTSHQRSYTWGGEWNFSVSHAGPASKPRAACTELTGAKVDGGRCPRPKKANLEIGSRRGSSIRIGRWQHLCQNDRKLERSTARARNSQDRKMRMLSESVGLTFRRGFRLWTSDFRVRLRTLLEHAASPFRSVLQCVSACQCGPVRVCHCAGVP